LNDPYSKSFYSNAIAYRQRSMPLYSPSTVKEFILLCPVENVESIAYSDVVETFKLLFDSA